MGVNASAPSAEQQSHCSRPALSCSGDRSGSAINSQPQRALMSGTGCCIAAVPVGSSGWSQARQVSGLLTMLKIAQCHPPGLSRPQLLAAGVWACCSRRLPVTLPWPAHFSCPRWVLLHGAVLFPTAERWESSQKHKLSFSAACEGEQVSLHLLGATFCAGAGRSPFSSHSIVRTLGLSEIPRCTWGIGHFVESIKSIFPSVVLRLFLTGCDTQEICVDPISSPRGPCIPWRGPEGSPLVSPPAHPSSHSASSAQLLAPRQWWWRAAVLQKEGMRQGSSPGFGASS